MKALSTVNTHMRRIPATIFPKMEVCEAVSLLLRHRTSALPVTAGGGELVGILAEEDCLDAFLSDEYYDSPSALVCDLMTTDVITVDADANILRAADLFSRYRFHLLPVLAGGNLIGQITRADVIQAILKTHHDIEIEQIGRRTAAGSSAAEEWASKYSGHTAQRQGDASFVREDAP